MKVFRVAAELAEKVTEADGFDKKTSAWVWHECPPEQSVLVQHIE
jgi:hypothetical protein